MYRNESEVCEAVKIFKSNSLTNSATGDIFLTSKVTGKEHGTEKTEKAVEESVKRGAEHGLVWVSILRRKSLKRLEHSTDLSSDAQDLFLLHDATSGPERRRQAWEVLIKKRNEGKIKSIGVSNFVSFRFVFDLAICTRAHLDVVQSEKHLQQLKDAGLETPAVNQVNFYHLSNSFDAVQAHPRSCYRSNFILSYSRNLL